MSRTLTLAACAALAAGLVGCGDDDAPDSAAFSRDAAAACAPVVSAVAGLNPASIDTVAQSAKQIADAIGTASGTLIKLSAPSDASRQALKGFVAKLAEEGVVVGQLQAAANANDPGTVLTKVKALNDTIAEADALAVQFGGDGCRQTGVLGASSPTPTTPETTPATTPITTPVTTPAAPVATTPVVAPTNPAISGGTITPTGASLFPPPPNNPVNAPALTLPPQTQAIAGDRRFEDLPPQLTPQGDYSFTFPPLEDFDGLLKVLNVTPSMQTASGTFGAVSVLDNAGNEFGQVGAFALDNPLPAGSVEAWVNAIADAGSVSPITIATLPGLHFTISESPVFVVGNDTTGIYVFVADTDTDLNRTATNFLESL